MVIRHLFYFAFLSLLTSPYLLADSFKEKKIKTSNSLTLVEDFKEDSHLISKPKKIILSDHSFDQNKSDYQIETNLFKFNKVSESINNSDIKIEQETLRINKPESIKWSVIETKDAEPADIKWKRIDIKNYRFFETSEYQNIFNYKDIYFKLLNIGNAVPTSETLSQGEIRLKIGQVSPLSSGYAKGTGNQNYLGETYYGFQDNFLISIFYTDADDPLTKRIVNLDTQPENRWSTYGSSIKWKFLENPQFKIAIEGSIENWLVQSGGCSGSNCSTNTSNIFNSSTSMVENNNLVGSISLPIGITYFSNLDFTISPKVSFLPEIQSNQYGEGDFYGNNYGIGFGIAYKALDRLKTFTSYYFPIGDSTNSFDDQLNFSKTSIYTLGLNYSIDSRTNFEAILSNGFGLSPATSVLSIPSSEEILYGFNIIYTPTNFDNYYDTRNQSSANSKFVNGLSVSNNSFINSEDSKLNIFYDVNGSWNSRYEKALSQRFIIDLTAGVIDKGILSKSNFKSYFSPGNTILRGGAKAILYSNKNKNVFTSALRGSFGRVLAESKSGYFFGESINSYDFNEKLSFNLNPKIGVTGSGEAIGLGTGLHWKFLKEITLISETNIPINNAENNITFGIRYTPAESNKHFDLYTSNAFSFIDMGQLMKREKNILGVNLGILF